MRQLPYVFPLFCGLPFHEHTVYAVNAALTLHACIMHSACHRTYDELGSFAGCQLPTRRILRRASRLTPGFRHAAGLMISPKGHNMHHNFGERNACNFGAIFKIYDRLGGTLNEGEPFVRRRGFNKHPPAVSMRPRAPPLARSLTCARAEQQWWKSDRAAIEAAKALKQEPEKEAKAQGSKEE